MFPIEQQLWVDETASTNDDARKLGEEGAPDGTVVIANAQHHGRGRNGRIWYGKPDDSLMFSALIRPKIPPDRWPMLPLLTAVAVQDALEGLGMDTVRIKWPNDLLVHGKKICGILCELSSEGTELSYAVLGIGLNVNTELDEMPEEIREIACSMRSLFGRSFDRKEVLALILERISYWLDLSVTNGFSAVRERWLQRNCTIGVQVTLDNGPVQVTGEVVGLADSGAIMLKDAQGKIHTIYSGDLHFV